MRQEKRGLSSGLLISDVMVVAGRVWDIFTITIFESALAENEVAHLDYISCHRDCQ